MDFRLKVFYTVATRLSFTKASSELFITQPAVSKHISELEQQYNITLFERNGNKIVLTDAGNLLLKYTKDVFEIYREIDFGMGALTKQQHGALRIGASTTVSQYIIPAVLAGFHKKSKDIRVNLVNGNTEQIEQALINKEIEVGIVEGQSKNPAIKYTELLKDELVLVCNSRNKLAKKSGFVCSDLLAMRFLLREPGSGTLEVIEHALRAAGIKRSQLAVEMQLGSSESIKSYLTDSDCVAFISIHAIQKELKDNLLTILDVSNLSMERYFYTISLHGKVGSLAESFAKFAANYNFR